MSYQRIISCKGMSLEHFIKTIKEFRDGEYTVFTGLDLPGADFSAMENEHRSLRNGSTLENCNLRGANFDWMSLYHFGFRYCDLREAKLSHISADGFIFTECLLDDAIIEDSYALEFVSCSTAKIKTSGTFKLQENHPVPNTWILEFDQDDE